MPRRTLDQLLDEAQARIDRLDPRDAERAAAAGALILDIRSQDARERDGVIPGALHVPRTVLEWRVDPDGEWRNDAIPAGSRVILVCDHGFSSILAAATLCELGYDAGDVVGGYEGWRDAGLPVRDAPPAWPGLPGLGPPD